MGQRYVELDSSYTGNADGTGVLSVSQLPPNPAILAPGPALVFVTVNGVPSVGVQIMIGSGKVGKQPVAAAQTLPTSTITQPDTSTSSGSSGSGSTTNSNQNGAAAQTSIAFFALAPVLLLLHALFLA